jgi:hypothetical protein
VPAIVRPSVQRGGEAGDAGAPDTRFSPACSGCDDCMFVDFITRYPWFDHRQHQRRL